MTKMKMLALVVMMSRQNQRGRGRGEGQGRGRAWQGRAGGQLRVRCCHQPAGPSPCSLQMALLGMQKFSDILQIALDSL